MSECRDNGGGSWVSLDRREFRGFGPVGSTRRSWDGNVGSDVVLLRTFSIRAGRSL